MIYTGSCHCKKVTFTVDIELTGLISCNCSYCAIKGLILGFAPRENLTIVTGSDNLTTYKFNKHVIDHTFCRDCGVQGFSIGKGPDGKETAAVNVRALHDVNLESLTITPYDGKSM